jgi:hypothetical protein
MTYRSVRTEANRLLRRLTDRADSDPIFGDVVRVLSDLLTVQSPSAEDLWPGDISKLAECTLSGVDFVVFEIRGRQHACTKWAWHDTAGRGLLSWFSDAWLASADICEAVRRGVWSQEGVEVDLVCVGTPSQPLNVPAAVGEVLHSLPGDAYTGSQAQRDALDAYLDTEVLPRVVPGTALAAFWSPA